ncbi:MAG: outer membrane protein [Stellaceae bacterium]
MRTKSIMVRHLLATTAVAALVYASEPANAQTFNWTGPYIGVNLGYIGQTQETSWGPPSFALSPLKPTATSQGVVGGLTGGYNYQFPGSHFVLGAEADIDFASGGKTSSGGGGCNCGFNKTKISSLATLRARFGYAVDKALFFATVGGAAGDVKNQSSYFGNPTSPLETAKKSGWKVGWTAGGGAEYAVSEHCVLKIEALWVDLGKSHALNSPTCGCTASFKNTAFVTRVGAAWKF